MTENKNVPDKNTVKIKISPTQAFDDPLIFQANKSLRRRVPDPSQGLFSRSYSQPTSSHFNNINYHLNAQGRSTYGQGDFGYLEKNVANFQALYFKEVPEIQKKIKDFSEEMIKNHKESSDLQEKFVDLSKKIDEAEDKLEENKIKAIETIGIFITLFTFISIEVSILENASTILSLLSLTTIFGGILILFILVFDLVIRYWNYGINKSKSKTFTIWKKSFWILVSLCLFLIISGFVLALFDYKDKEDSHDDIDSSLKIEPSSSVDSFVEATSSAKEIDDSL